MIRDGGWNLKLGKYVLKVMRPEATYLVWVDCRELGLDGQALASFMKDRAKVAVRNL